MADTRKTLIKTQLVAEDRLDASEAQAETILLRINGRHSTVAKNADGSARWIKGSQARVDAFEQRRQDLDDLEARAIKTNDKNIADHEALTEEGGKIDQNRQAVEVATSAVAEAGHKTSKKDRKGHEVAKAATLHQRLVTRRKNADAQLEALEEANGKNGISVADIEKELDSRKTA